MRERPMAVVPTFEARGEAAEDSHSAAWMCGVVFAAGYLARLGGDVRACELLEEIGVVSTAQLRALDCPDYDIDGVRRLLPEIRRRAKPAKR